MLGGAGGQAILWVQHQHLLPQAVPQIFHSTQSQVVEPGVIEEAPAHIQRRPSIAIGKRPPSDFGVVDGLS